MTHWIWTIVIGFVVGAIAKLLTRGIVRAGFWVTTIVGVAGAVAATYVGQRVGWYPEGHPAGFIASILGAVALLILFQLFTGTRR